MSSFKLDNLPKLVLITDEAVAHRNGKSCVATIANVINRADARGLSVLLQIRNKNLLPGPFHRYVESFLRRLRPLVLRPPIIVVNEFVYETDPNSDLLFISGVHRPAHPLDTLTTEQLRAQYPELLIGQSCHNFSELQAAEGADYVTFSPIFFTPSKPDYGPAVGIEQLTQAVQQTKIPIFALGGIDPGNAKSVMKSGCYGLAVMGGIYRTSNLLRYIDPIIDAIVSTL